MRGCDRSEVAFDELIPLISDCRHCSRLHRFERDSKAAVAQLDRTVTELERLAAT